MTPKAKTCSTAGTLMALMLLAAAWIFPRSVGATEKYAAQTGVSCAQCHVYPTGDARLTPFGEAFIANGFKLPAKPPKPPVDNSKPPAKPPTATNSLPK